MLLSVIMRAILIIILIFIVGLYFWYVQGIDIGPIINQIRRVHVSFEKVPDPLESQDKALGLWSRMPNMPTQRSEVAVAALDTKIYVIGGFDSFARNTDVVEVYDTDNKTWSSFPPLPVKLHHAASATLNGKLYVIGGMVGLNFEPINKIWVLEEEPRDWKELADMPEAVGAAAAVGFTPGGNGNSSKARVYVFGGVKKGGLSQKTFAYNPIQNEWTEAKPIPTPREHLPATVIDDQIYVAGGREQSLSKNLNTLEIYDPVKELWSVGPSMPTRRSGITAASLGKKIYVFGGEYIFGTNREVEVFDPVTKSWNTLNPMPTSRHGAGSAVVANSIYVVAGGKRPWVSVSTVNEAFVPPEFVQESQLSEDTGLSVEILNSATSTQATSSTASTTKR